MKIYEAPLAEVIDFSAREQIAVIPDETIGREPEIDNGSIDF